ncbi:MAG: hypothetical protein J7M25_03890 [Deltaproteobacteria bacterium]|nr:hypothetical protein [Deltaproteobacteria bacterium]
MLYNSNRGWVETFRLGSVLIVVALGVGWGSCRRGLGIKLAVGESDILEAGSLTMKESQIQMAWQGDDLVVSYQVQSSQTGTINLDVVAWIVDHKQGGRSDPVTGYVQVVDGEGKSAFVFPGLGSRIDDRDMGDYVLRLAVVGLTSGQLLAHRALPHRKPDQSLEVFAQDSFEKDGTGVVRVVAHQAGAATPLAGVPVAVRLSQWDRSWSAAQGKTDARGELTLEFPVDATSLSNIDMRVVTSLGEEEIVSSAVRLKPRQNTRIVLTTDKPIYQPEQTIHMRVLALDGPSLLPMAQTDGLFEVFDSKERKVAKFAVYTNAYGIASATMKLGRVIDLGSYRVHAEVGVISTDRTIKVSRYALPRFRVSVATDRPYYLPAQVVTGSIQAEYFFGQKVAQAQVLLKAYTYEAGFTQFAELTLFTDDQGEASFSLLLPNTFFGTEFLQGNASLLIQATVTDAAGHAETSSRSLVVAPSDVLIFVVPEAGHVVPGVDNRFFVETVDPTGAPLPCNVSISAPGVDAVRANTDENGIDVVTISGLSRQATLTTHASCAGGVSADKSVSIQAGQGAELEGLVVRADRPTAVAGDRVPITILAPRAKDVVYLDVVHHGHVLSSKNVDVAQGVGSANLDVTPDMTGLLELRAYYVASSGVVIRNTRLLYVKHEDALSVDLSTDQEQYRPGQTAVLGIHVTDSSGRGAQAAVGLSVVDEAVYALTDFRPGLEKQFYDFESALLNPSYQVKGCSFEDLDRADQDDASREKADLYLATLNRDQAFYPVRWTLKGSVADMDHTVAIGAVARDATTLGDLASGRFSNVEGLQEALNAAALFDPWGRPYQAEATGSQLCLTSFGPDERKGTEDDIKAICASVSYKTVTSTSGSHDGAFHDGAAFGLDAGYVPHRDAGMPRDGGYPVDGSVSDGGSSSGPRLRKDFPETLYFDPAVITDSQGRATVQIPLADSITTWKVAAIANAATGGLGSTDHGILVFQPFFVEPDLPAYLLNDVDVAIPVAVYNYSSSEQDVTLQLRQDSWFTLLDSNTKDVVVPAQSLRATSFAVHVVDVGRHPFHVTATSADFSDAVEKQILVRPNGKEYPKTCGGFLTSATPQSCQVTFPSVRVDGADELLVKIYMSQVGHAVEGLDSMIREPYGCFEQTTSVTWPNVLVLKYLRDNHLTNPGIELKARQNIALGYQRMLTFHHPDSGGFSWFGEDAEHLVLTAYGLMEMTDMAQVYDVDQSILDGAARFIANRQKSDGSWTPDQDRGFGIGETVSTSTFQTTTFAAWALTHCGLHPAAVESAKQYLLSNQSEATTLFSKSLLVRFLTDSPPADSAMLFDLLEDLASAADRNTADGTAVWTTEGSGSLYDHGKLANLETTALAVAALSNARVHSELVQDGIAYLVGQKDSLGNLGTQATVLMLKALLDARGPDQAVDGTVSILLNDQPAAQVTMTPETSDVFRVVDLKNLLAADDNKVDLVFSGDGRPSFQVVGLWYVPWDQVPQDDPGPLSIDVSYDRTELQVNQTITVQVTVQNNETVLIPMVMLDLGIPPGFEPMQEDLDALRTNGTITSYEVTDRQIIMYLSHLDGGQQVQFDYRIQATMAFSGESPGYRVYAYYTPEMSSYQAPIAVTVSE